MNATRKVLDQSTRHLHGEARLADTARACDRDQPHILTQQEFSGGIYFLLPPHKHGPLYGKIGWTGFHRHNGLVRKAVADGCELQCDLGWRRNAYPALSPSTSQSPNIAERGRHGFVIRLVQLVPAE